jgi:phosphatidylethanolamine-binding protein (PEBP) family uncharacterized protein
MFKKMLLRMALIIYAASLAGCGNIPQTMGEPGAQNTPAIPPAQQTTRDQSPSSLASDSATATLTSEFTLTSPTVVEGGILPAEYTCDGLSATLALSWSEAPVGTQSFAVVMHHMASPEDVHWYWVLYDIPASVTSLPKNSHGIGILGTNSVNDRTEYTPPCSKGPGLKVYTYTLYALSEEPQFSVPASQVSRDVLLEAIRNITLASAELHVTYTRE